MAAAPKRKTFDEVFPPTLPASDAPPLYHTIVEGQIAPWYALGWTFEEFELEDLFSAQKDWNPSWDVFSDSQMLWVNPRWMKYSKELAHYHCPMIEIMPNGDALFKIAINASNYLSTLNASRQKIINAAVDVLGLSAEKVPMLQWYRTDPYC